MRILRRRRNILCYLVCISFIYLVFVFGFGEITNHSKKDRSPLFSNFRGKIPKIVPDSLSESYFVTNVSTSIETDSLTKERESLKTNITSTFLFINSTSTQEHTSTLNKNTTKTTSENKNPALQNQKEWLKAKMSSKKKDWTFYRINTSMSDIVDVRRKLPDARSEECIRAALVYPDSLPAASVVIIFRDEWPSVLIRTIYSLLGNTPPNLLEEIVLVNDGSEDTELMHQIDIHFAYVEKIKLIVNPKPLGLMKARQIGIESTLSDYFVVMDSHIEFSEGWLEPLLARLVQQPFNLLTSNVGGIKPETFEGMSIAMRKEFFLKIGGFDPGMRQWGAEQFELSIKTWMCGGRVENVPCSNIAHLYRVTPWGKVNKKDDFTVANSLRTTEVWFDDPYKSIVREVIGRHSHYDIGDLTDRKRIRQVNNCKPFQYFIDTAKNFSGVYLLDKIKAKGEIKNRFTNSCLAISKQKDNSYKLMLQACNNDSNQYFIHSEKDQVRSIWGTLIRSTLKRATNASVPVEVLQSSFYKFIKEAAWFYRDEEALFNIHTKKCLTVVNKNELFLKACDKTTRQKWTWQRL